ncbi:MAG: M28 family peptidase, partial [Bacteroidia bacterium]|nr:M28 family peptidase [Bacteroidia bacterium]
GESWRVSPGNGKTTCAFFRPGTQEVMFSSTHLNPNTLQEQKAELEFRLSGKKRRYAWDYDSTMDIFSASIDGTNLKRLTTANGYDAEGAYSPDGKLIVFSSLRSAYDGKLTPEEQKQKEIDPSYFGEVYLMNADGSNVRRLTNWPGYDGGTFFSPDGKRIIWRHFEPDGKTADVYSMDLNGKDVRRITQFQSMSWAPYYHPSQQYVIFSSNKLGYSNFELYIADTSGKSEPIRVTFTEGFDGLPVFSPDGKQLAWSSTRTPDGSSQIFIATWNHEAALQALKQTASTITSPVNSGNSSTFSISEERLKKIVSYLASDELEGRLTGSNGAKKTASFLVSELKAMNIQPLQSDYLVPFRYTADVTLASLTMEFSTNKKTISLSDLGGCYSFSASLFSQTADCIWAGYGIFSPHQQADSSYFSIPESELKQKWVFVLEGLPENISPEETKRYQTIAKAIRKATAIKNAGAKGIVLLTWENKITPVTKAEELSLDLGIPVLRLPVSALDKLFPKQNFSTTLSALHKANLPLSTIEKQVSEKISFQSFSLKASGALNRIVQTDYNVVGIIPGKTDSIVWIGAHYDHLGYGEVASLAQGEEKKQIHNGADDNASGVAAVLEIAKAIQEKNGNWNYSLGIGFWSGEEEGILGSNDFTQTQKQILSRSLSYLNFDMVGRMKDNRLILQGLGSGTWKKAIERLNVAAGFQLDLQDDPYLPTDATAFYTKGIPILSFFTGIHSDYHKPSDDVANINFTDLKRITLFATRLTDELLIGKTKPVYQKFESTSSGHSKTSATVSLGTIPDYGASVTGMKLSGVREGGPAAKAGLKGGDIIIGLAGKPVTNIYDYMNILETLKPNTVIPIEIVRDGKTIVLQVTPIAK